MAIRKSTLRQPQQEPTAPALPANYIDPATMPDEYGLTISGNCMAPALPEGTIVHVDKREPCRAGDFVCIYFKPELIKPGFDTGWVKRLFMAPPPWVTFPYQDHPESEVLAIMFAALDWPERKCFQVKCSSVQAMHRVLGPLDLARAKPVGPAGKRALRMARGRAAQS